MIVCGPGGVQGHALVCKVLRNASNARDKLMQAAGAAVEKEMAWVCSWWRNVLQGSS